jgi:lipopolysaccharide transport system permease protein
MTNMNASAAEIAAPELTTRSYVSIKASRGWRGFNFRELWLYRELLFFLIWRDLKVRYKQTVLGIAWIVVQPALMTATFTLVLGMFARIPSGSLPYPLLVYGGLLPWTFFSSGVLGCAVSLTGNANLITKVYFPRVLIPIANVFARLVDFTISFSILAGLMMYYRMVKHHPIPLGSKLVAFPLIVILLISLTLAFGMLVSCLNVKYRDVGVALPVLLQLLMFISPIVYPINIVPESWRTLYYLNPLTGIVQTFRAVLFNEPVMVFGLVSSVVFTLVLLVISALVFSRTETTFADNV